MGGEKARTSLPPVADRRITNYPPSFVHYNPGPTELVVRIGVVELEWSGEVCHQWPINDHFRGRMHGSEVALNTSLSLIADLKDQLQLDRHPQRQGSDAELEPCVLSRLGKHLVQQFRTSVRDESVLWEIRVGGDVDTNADDASHPVEAAEVPSQHGEGVEGCRPRRFATPLCRHTTSEDRLPINER